MADEPTTTSNEVEAAEPGKRMTRLGLLHRGAVAGAAGIAAGSVAHVSPAAAAPAAPPRPCSSSPHGSSTTSPRWRRRSGRRTSLGPGARVAGVGYYIDGQLPGSWGQGHRFYLNGPFFTPADSGHGWQVPMTPADVYRAFLPGFDQYVRNDVREHAIRA